MTPRQALWMFGLSVLLAGADARADRVGDDDFPGEHVAIVAREVAALRFGAVPGRQPTEAYPRGTVIVAWCHQRRGPMLTEWDVARRRVVRKLALGWQPGDLQLKRWGNLLVVAVEVAGSDPNGIAWALLDADDWRTLAKGGVDGAANPTVFLDGTRLLVAYTDRPPNLAPPTHMRLDALDHGGRVLATWTAPYGRPGAWHGIGLFAGDIYVLETRDAGSPQLVRLAVDHPDQKLVTRYTGTALDVESDRMLVYGDRDGVVELAPDLHVLERSMGAEWLRGPVSSDGFMLQNCRHVVTLAGEPRGVLRSGQSGCFADFWLGDVPVIFTVTAEGDPFIWLSWMDPDAARRQPPARPARVAPPRDAGSP